MDRGLSSALRSTVRVTVTQGMKVIEQNAKTAWLRQSSYGVYLVMMLVSMVFEC